MKINNKTWLIIIIVIVVIVLAVGGYFWYKKASKPIVWDGNYKMTGTLACTGNFPQVKEIPMDTTIIVVSNKIVDQTTGKTFDIDRNGKTNEVIEQSANGVNTKVEAVYQFSNKDNAYKFVASGKVDLSATNTQAKTNYASTCTGNLNGVKQ